MNAKPTPYDQQQVTELVATFFGMVMTMCKQIGIDEKDAIALFSAKHIKGGYALLDKKDTK